MTAEEAAEKAKSVIQKNTEKTVATVLVLVEAACDRGEYNVIIDHNDSMFLVAEPLRQLGYVVCLDDDSEYWTISWNHGQITTTGDSN